jgi:FkbM family methyltransferase
MDGMNRALFRHNTSDANIWENVVGRNEYKLADQFEPGSLVLDIGGNTGAFTYACIQRGAAKVIAFEPDPDNFHIFRKQLKAEIADGRVEVYPLAVVGGSGFSWRTFSGVVQKDGEINHGGAFLFSKKGSDYGLSEYITGRPFEVPCLGIQDVLSKWEAPSLCKLDCEMGEFEITDSLWAAVDRRPAKVVGEYHPYGDNTLERLIENLKCADYETEVVPHLNSTMGLFFSR